MMMAINQSSEDPELITDARQLLRERKGKIKLLKKAAATKATGASSKDTRAYVIED
jgi:hypothetical protein